MDVAAADTVVPDLHLADHFDQQFGQVLTTLHVFQQWLVTRAHRAPVEAMHVGVVEIGLLHPPDLVEDLLPFLVWIDEHPQSIQFNGLGVELLGGVGDVELVLAQHQQQLLAVGAGRDIHEGRAELLLAAILETVSIEVGVRAAVGERSGWLLARAGLLAGKIEQGPVGRDDQSVVITLGDRDGHEALRQARQVDASGLYGRSRFFTRMSFIRRMRFVSFILVLALFLRGTHCIGIVLALRVFSLTRKLLVAAFRRQRGVAVGREHGRVNGLAQWALLRGHVQRRATRSGVDRSREIQQLVAPENGVVGLDEFVRQFRALPGRKVKELHAREIVVTDHRIGNPLAVRRYCCLEAETAFAGIEQGYRIGLELQDVEVEVVVLEDDAPAVRRPLQQRKVRGLVRGAAQGVVYRLFQSQGIA